MSAQSSSELQLQIGHVLFIDVVAYSKRLLDDQRELQEHLNQVVRATPSFRKSEAADKLVRLPTGDGMALVFSESVEAPVQCAVEISEALRDHPQLQLRMGINTGPVSGVADVNDRSNVAGAGINIAQRVMDLGDAGHILLSKRAAEDLLQYRQWQTKLHDLGEFEAKHGLKLGVVNLTTDKAGNPRLPKKLEVERRRQVIRRRLRRAISAVTFVLVLALVAGAVWFVMSRRAWLKLADNAATSIPEKSIAVLPFESLSEEKENAYFADGIQDDILTDLARVADLKVISRTSVMQYRGAAKNLREIGRALGVAHVLEGSVRKVAGRVRVNAQLIDTRTDAHQWAEQFDRDLADVFAIQSELAQRIVAQLKATLSPSEKAAIEEKPTNDLEAYDLYLRGKALDNNILKSKDVHADLLKAVEFFEAAVARDPGFALAYCGIAKMRLYLYWFWGYASADLTQAEAAVQTAVRLAPQLGEAHLEQAHYYYHGHRDYEKALEELAIAGRLLPNSAEVLSWKGAISRRVGHWDDAVSSYLKAVELDPRAAARYYEMCITYIHLRRYSEAEGIADLGLRRIPETENVFGSKKAEIALEQGDTKRARALLETVSKEYQGPWDLVNVALQEHNFPEVSRLLFTIPKDELDADNAVNQALVLRKLGDGGKVEPILLEVRETLQKTKRDKTGEADLVSSFALIDAALGRKEDALHESQQALEMLPISRDAVDGPAIATRRARVLMLVGDHEGAIELLRQLNKIPGGPSYGDLLSLVWDDLRDDPRFKAIVASLKPKDAR